MVCIYPCVIVTIDTQNNNQQLTNFWQLILVAFFGGHTSKKLLVRLKTANNFQDDFCIVGHRGIIKVSQRRKNSLSLSLSHVWHVL